MVLNVYCLYKFHYYFCACLLYRQIFLNPWSLPPSLSLFLICGSYLVFVVWLPCAARERERKITNGSQLWLLLYGVRKRELFLRFFFLFSSLHFPFIHSFFWHQSTIAFPSCSYSSRSPTPSISLCVFACDHVQQSLDSPYAMFCTVVVRSHLLPYYFSFSSYVHFFL